MTRVNDFEVQPDKPLSPDEILALESRVTMNQDIRDAMEELRQRLWQTIHWAFVPANRKAAEIIAQHWQEWISLLLSDQDEVYIDVTAFVEKPDEGNAGAHMVSLLALLTLLGNRGGASWSSRWKKGKPWIARFGPRRKEGNP